LAIAIFLSCAFGIDLRQMYTHRGTVTHPLTFHSYFTMERIYLCAVYYHLHMGIFVFVDLNFIIRLHESKENELKKDSRFVGYVIDICANAD
jgi:hypothetical protein